MAKSSRYGFYPPISPLINKQYKSGKPIAQHVSYTWQTVSRELAPGMAIKEKTSAVTTAKAPNIKTMVRQAQLRADNASEQNRVHARLRDEKKKRGSASYHNALAGYHAEDAYVKQQMAIATSRIDTSITMVNSVFGIYGSLAAVAKEAGDRNYGIITKNITSDLGLLGQAVPDGLTLHFEYHYGMEPSKAKQFGAGMSMMFGGDTEANNEFMVTAVLTQPGRRRITATRLVKMIWYAGEGNLKRAFPAGYEEYNPILIPNPRGGDPYLLYYQVLNQLAHAAVDDIRYKLKRRK